MIDRDARNKAVVLLRDYQIGKRTEAELKRSWPGKTSDPALPEILLGILPSSHYKNFKVKELEVSPEERGIRVYRSLIFLESNLPYAWPLDGGFMTWMSLVVLVFVAGIIGVGIYFKAGTHFHYIVGLGVWVVGLLVKRRHERKKALGNYEVWPFLNRGEYEQELERIELIKGFGQADYWGQIGA
jgi:hypothetical protein